MGGLGHYLEEEGIPTTQISLIREHTEKIRPPRALWVPFELGRPLGAPDEPDFQRRVLGAALALLGRDEGPVLEDFPEDAPGEVDMTGWVCPVHLPQPDEGELTLAEMFEREVDEMRTWYDVGLKRRGRTALGASRLAIEELPRFVAAFLEGAPDNPRDDVPLGLAFRFAVEDLKLFYVEAATAQPGGASSKDLNDWLWNHTACGKVFRALRPILAEAEDETLKRVADIVIRPPEEMLKLT